LLADIILSTSYETKNSVMAMSYRRGVVVVDIRKWNCTHIGTRTYALVYEYNQKRGLHTPIFFTPETLIIFEREGSYELL
jgi:hypothetical protein